MVLASIRSLPFRTDAFVYSVRLRRQSFLAWIVVALQKRVAEERSSVVLAVLAPERGSRSWHQGSSNLTRGWDARVLGLIGAYNTQQIHGEVF